MRVRGWPACRAITPVVYAAAVVTAAAGLPSALENSVGGPYRLCVIQDDAAQNPGVIFGRELS
jgi:hypothetical protein